ncbi:hypothetical protein BDV29DRAFT_171530 [Aspergillus leporis]|jgi:hypothetical protein|uniref:Uncharacterized protein n=1 Tax=Aspergillus leporis TaxID=41062 RepID=A0A5N5X4I1_9EURO|nr:hypothetical protein BDV29DRAFT_171530 [Aspergillus leporis]
MGSLRGFERNLTADNAACGVCLVAWRPKLYHPSFPRLAIIQMRSRSLAYSVTLLVAAYTSLSFLGEEVQGFVLCLLSHSVQPGLLMGQGTR